MIAIDIAIAGCGIAMIVAAFRIARGPTPADQVVAAELLTASVIGLIALLGTRLQRVGTFDLVIVATLVAFIAAVSLARALTGGRR